MVRDAAVFIDGGHMNSVLDSLGRIRINYADFVAKMTRDFQLLRAYYYDCPPYQSQPPSPEEEEAVRNREKFFHALRKQPRFEVRLGYLAFKGYTAEGKPILNQKSTDIRLATDMVRMSVAGLITTAFLVAADGDYVPAVQAVKDAGVSLHLFHGTPYSQALWDCSDVRSNIDWDFLQDCLLR